MIYHISHSKQEKIARSKKGRTTFCKMTSACLSKSEHPLSISNASNKGLKNLKVSNSRLMNYNGKPITGLRYPYGRGYGPNGPPMKGQRETI